jgi:RNA-directed DNA polymerase
MRAERRSPAFWLRELVNQRWEEPVSEAKPYVISKQLVWHAYRRVKANQGAAGVDGETLAMFEKELRGNLYKLWNRMSSGSYFPPAVRLVEIPKESGDTSPLGIPTVTDRLAQTKMVLEPLLEPFFHEDSYRYRPGKSALDAVEVARTRCWRANWVIDLDTKSFFDCLDHDLVERAVAKHTPTFRGSACTSRGGSVHRCNDQTALRSNGPRARRKVASSVHCSRTCFCTTRSILGCGGLFRQSSSSATPTMQSSTAAARGTQSRCSKRSVIGFKECGLELHPTKTQIVYCKDDDRRGNSEHVSFDFLGYTFQPRRAKNRWGNYFVSFLPAISTKAARSIRKTIREWRMASTRNNQQLEDLARALNPTMWGWMNYYGRFYRSKFLQILRHFNAALSAWVRRKYQNRFRRRERASSPFSLR